VPLNFTCAAPPRRAIHNDNWKKRTASTGREVRAGRTAGGKQTNRLWSGHWHICVSPSSLATDLWWGGKDVRAFENPSRHFHDNSWPAKTKRPRDNSSLGQISRSGSRGLIFCPATKSGPLPLVRLFSGLFMVLRATVVFWDTASTRNFRPADWIVMGADTAVLMKSESAPKLFRNAQPWSHLGNYKGLTGGSEAAP